MGLELKIGVSLIPTSSKEKLPKGFSYPLGAEAISAALEGAPHFGRSHFTFRWQDEYQTSEWQKRIKARGLITQLHIWYFDFFDHLGPWTVRVNSVPSEYSVCARDHLKQELPRVRKELLAAGLKNKSFKTSIMFDLSIPLHK